MPSYLKVRVVPYECGAEFLENTSILSNRAVCGKCRAPIIVSYFLASYSNRAFTD